jgi:hypothetical protein
MKLTRTAVIAMLFASGTQAIELSQQSSMGLIGEAEHHTAPHKHAKKTHDVNHKTKSHAHVKTHKKAAAHHVEAHPQNAKPAPAPAKPA